MNTNKNSYTLIYIVVIIVIVSLLLSVVSGLLRTRQQDNVRLDTKKQILGSLPSVQLTGDASEIFAQNIVKTLIINELGETVNELDPVGDFDYETAEGEYKVFVAEVEGATKYIIPLRGVGLWNAIWGYIALDDDRNTVFGVYYGHAGETPGLGAKIVDEFFREQFIGKQIIKEGELRSIAVLKKGQVAENQDMVDAISGATITSTAVQTMLADGLKPYTAFLTAAAPTEEVEEIVEPAAEEVAEI